jgi:succinate dehydrogenase/fumarate reductase flavoprotein subunit
VVLRAALARTESRGAHHRRDHPASDPAQARSTLVDARTVVRLGPSLAAAAARALTIAPARPQQGTP